MTMSIVIEPIPANPGYTAAISGGDPEIDPIGMGATRMAAALDLARSLLDEADNHIAVCLAIAAVLREELRIAVPSCYGECTRGFRWGTKDADAEWGAFASGMERAINTVEGIW